MRPKHIIIITLLIGLGLFSYSLLMPYYKDQSAYENLMSSTYDQSEYYKRIAELRTNKIVFMDLGAGLAIASITIFVFLFLEKIKNWADFKTIYTIGKRSIFIWSNLVWLLLFPGTYWYYIFRGGRGDYPPFADSIGIPIMTQIPFYALLLIPLNLFIFLSTIKTNLPTKIFIIVERYNTLVILWEFFFGFWLLINLFCFVEFIIDGDHFAIPVNLFFTYILLALRAGQINRLKSELNMPAYNKV